MPHEPRVTIRLSPVLYAQLAARGQTGQPLAAIVRQALEEFLTRQPEIPQSTEPLIKTVAAMAVTIAELQEQVQELTARVETLAANRQPTRPSPRQPMAARRPPASAAERLPVADTAARPQRGGRPRSTLSEQIEVLLREHPEGLTAEQLRGYLAPARPLGNILQGMRRTGRVRVEREGRQIRHFAP